MRPAFGLSSVVFLVACGHPSTTSAPPTTSPPAPLPAPAPLAAPAASTVLYIDTTGTHLAEPRVLVPLSSDPSLGADASFKRSGPNDLYLVPLGEALANEKAHGRLHVPLPIVVGASTTYRVLVEALFTAGQSDVGEFTLHEDSLDGRSFSFRPPRVSAWRGLDSPVERRLNLTALVVTDGIGVKAASGNLAPGCDELGSGLAVPRKNGALDLVLLARCIEKVKAANPEFQSEREATLVANPGIPFREIMDVALTLQGPSQSVFPELALAVPR